MKAPVIPESGRERWDKAAREVGRAKGEWVLVATEGQSYAGRNDRVRKALESRLALPVEVRSRTGKGNTLRPWKGERTWARLA